MAKRGMPSAAAADCRSCAVATSSRRPICTEPLSVGVIVLNENFFVLLLHPAQDLFAGLPHASMDDWPVAITERRR